MYLAQYVINSHFIVYSFFHLLSKIIIFAPTITFLKIFLKFYIGAQLINNVVLVSGVQQSNSTGRSAWCFVTT